MFIFGLVLGPALGLLVGDLFARRSAAGSRNVAAVVVAAAALLVLFVPFAALSFRMGLVPGFLLGFLLYSTPEGPILSE